MALTPTALMATNVSGTVFGTWTTNGSPYRVVGDIQVSVLNINPGVTVLFTSNYVFQVAGTLQASGTSNAPIVFTATNGGWQGIFFNASGSGSFLSYCMISNSLNSGIRVFNSNPTIINSTIANNTAPGSGGGIIITNAGIAGVLNLVNCTIVNNKCVGSGGGVAALTATNGSIRMVGCVVSNNLTNPSLINETSFGGGVEIVGNATLHYCSIRNNACRGVSAFSSDQTSDGGGILVETGSTVLQNCLIISNSASTTGGGVSYAYGGGLGITGGATLWATNSILGWNSVSASGSFGANYNGGGVSIPANSGGAFVNCTFAYNNIEGLNCANTALPVINSIFFFNNGGGTQIIGITNVTYSDVQGGFTGQGNINQNPIFLDNSDLIIVPGSPCIDRGSTNAIYNDQYFPPSLGSLRNDIGAQGGPGSGATLTIRLRPQIEVDFYGVVPGYNYEIDASTNLPVWQAVQTFQISHLGDYISYVETNSLPSRFYKLNVAP